jgi:hypothetical protein
MDRRVKTLEAFVKIVQDQGRNFLGKIIMINELALSVHMLEMKLPYKQWLKKRSHQALLRTRSLQAAPDGSSPISTARVLFKQTTFPGVPI